MTPLRAVLDQEPEAADRAYSGFRARWTGSDGSTRTVAVRLRERHQKKVRLVEHLGCSRFNGADLQAEITKRTHLVGPLDQRVTAAGVRARPSLRSPLVYEALMQWDRAERRAAANES
jgi:hypothetical protein